MRTITIQTDYGPREVEAIAVAKTLYVHRAPWAEAFKAPRHAWTITHGKTGYSIQKNCYSQKSALQAAKEIIGLGIDWEFESQADSKKIPLELRQRAHEICQQALMRPRSRVARAGGVKS